MWKEAVPDKTAEVIQVSSQTSFFELGGNALLLLKLQILINTQSNVKLSVIDLFGAAPLGAMAAKIMATPPADFID